MERSPYYEMKIIEVIRIKKEYEEKLTNLLREFESKTGLQIKKIFQDTHSIGFSRGKPAPKPEVWVRDWYIKLDLK
jgi:hypothetical protein